VSTGYEFAFTIENYHDIKENDSIEAFEIVTVARS
jgi:hypothetical protein